MPGTHPRPTSPPAACGPLRVPHSHMNRRSDPHEDQEEAAGLIELRSPPAAAPVPPEQGMGLLGAIELKLAASPAATAKGDGDGEGEKETGAAVTEEGVPTVPMLPGYKRLRAFLMVCVTWSATLQSCLGPFFPIHMRERFGASAFEIGGVFAVLSVSQSIICPFIATISRRIGRANTLRIGILISIAGGLIFSIDQVWAFFVSRILQGVGDGMIDNSSIALLMHHSPNLSRDVGLLEGSSSLGFLFGPLLAGLLYGLVGFRHLFFIFTAPFAGVLLLACFAPQFVLPGATRIDSKEEQAREAQEEARESGSILRALKALRAAPSHLVYLGIVMLVAGSLGFFDTSLAEHLAVALDVSSFQAGLFFTIQIVVYVLFSLVAAEAATRFGEWPTIMTGSFVWAVGMFTIGPAPSLHVHIKSKQAALGVIASSLAVLGASETAVFIPFVPLLHGQLRGPAHGWAPQEAEDAVAALWTTAFALGQTLGPLVGGGLMDALPNIEEIGCTIGGRTEAKAPEEGGPCLSSFPWVAAVWGAMGLLTWFALAFCLLCERAGVAGGDGTKDGIVGMIARRYRRFKSLAVGKEEGEGGDDEEAASPMPAPPSLRPGVSGSGASYSRGGSGLGRRPILFVTRSALGSKGLAGAHSAAAMVRSASSSMLSRPSRFGVEGSEEEWPQTR